jgi:hypothetical protein
MKTIDDGGAAYPQHGWSSNPEVLERMKACAGMTLRDWFAGQALAGRMPHDQGYSAAQLADGAYAMADAMIAERGKK